MNAIEQLRMEVIAMLHSYTENASESELEVIESFISQLESKGAK